MEIKLSPREGFVQVFTPYSSALVDFFHNLPSSQWSRSAKCWEVSIYDLAATAKAIETITGSPIPIDDNAKREWQTLRERYNTVLKLSSGELATEVRVPGLKTKLFPFQERAVALVTQAKRFLLAYDVGLGKTVISIAVALWLKQQKGSCKVLVVCKGSHKHRPWTELISRFCDEKYVVVEGSPRTRKSKYARASRRGITFVIINYEMLTTDAEFNEETGKLVDIGPLKDVKFDLVVLDEVVKIKNYKTKISKVLRLLVNNVEYVVGLSGTPIKHSVIDLYGIYRVINKALFSNYMTFIKTYCVTDRYGNVVNFCNLDKLVQRIKYFSHQLSKTDVLTDLPDVIINNYSAPLVKAQQEALQWLITAVDAGMVDSLAAVVYLREICNSALLVTAVPGAGDSQHSGKTDMLNDILEELFAENPKRKVVVFSYFAKMVRLLETELRAKYPGTLVITGETSTKCVRPDVQVCKDCGMSQRCASRKKYVWQFQNVPECNVMIGTDAISEGYDLFAADVVVNYDLPWTSAEFKQRLGRIYRIGQLAKKVNVINLVCLNTIEEKIVDKINRREKLSNTVIGDYSFGKIDIGEIKELKAREEE